MNIAKKHFRSVVLLACAFVIVALVAVGCKKKSEPTTQSKAPSMEDVTKKAAATAEKAKEKATAAAEDAKEAATEAVKSIEQTTCPVMDGNPINKNVFVEYKGKKVYFCCPDCKAKFEADPEKYIAKLPQFQK